MKHQAEQADSRCANLRLTCLAPAHPVYTNLCLWAAHKLVRAAKDLFLDSSELVCIITARVLPTKYAPTGSGGLTKAARPSPLSQKSDGQEQQNAIQ
jgi:hypothetical protein